MNDCSGIPEDLKNFNGNVVFNCCCCCKGNNNNSQTMSELEAIFIYPNGGSKENPAQVQVDSRYEMSNPFAGYVVKCRAEVLYNGKWGETGFSVNCLEGVQKAYGTVACQLLDENEDIIVVQTGDAAVLGQSNWRGNPFGISYPPAGPKSLPCRVYVEKGGKLLD